MYSRTETSVFTLVTYFPAHHRILACLIRDARPQNKLLLCQSDLNKAPPMWICKRDARALYLWIRTHPEIPTSLSNCSQVACRAYSFFLSCIQRTWPGLYIQTIECFMSHPSSYLSSSELRNRSFFTQGLTRRRSLKFVSSLRAYGFPFPFPTDARELSLKSEQIILDRKAGYE